MSWTLTVVPAQGGSLAIVLPDPEFGDVETARRRQLAGETDGGEVFVQDLGVEDQFIDANWQWLDETNRSDLLRFLRAAEFRSRPIKIEMSGETFPVGLSTGQTFDGVALSTGATIPCQPPLSTGATVAPDTATFNDVLIENAEVALEQIRNGQSNVSLRFRIPGGPVKAGG